MKFFWDTSAVINAAVSQAVEARLDADEHAARVHVHAARVHVFCEFFATMTGRGVMAKDADGQPVKVLFSQDDAAKWLKEFCKRVELVELDGKEVLDGLDKTQSLNVQGARIYDYAHALAAIKARADVVLTRNTNHFAGLTGKATVEWP